MNAQANLNLIEDVKAGVNEMIDATTAPAPKKAKRPAKPVKAEKPKAAEAEAAKPVRNAKPAKPEPVLFKGFALADGASPEAVETAAKKAQEALDAIKGSEAGLVGHYMTLGQFQSEAAPLFKSTKLYGEFLKAELPASQALDPALRSNCKWLFEALNAEGHEASDLLTVLGVNRIEDFKSGNPTVIRREYKAAKAEADKAAALKAKAEAEGVDVSEAEKLMKEEAEAQAKKDQAAAKRKLTSLEKKVKAFLMQHGDNEEMATEASDLIRGLIEANPKEQIAYLESIVG
jgi:hypothetical protein